MPINSTQNTKRNSRNAATMKSTSVNKKSKPIILEVENKSTPPYTLEMSSALDYNMVEYMEKACTNISLFELTKIMS